MASTRDLVEVPARELRKDDRDGSLMRGRRIVAVRPTSDGRLELAMQWSNGKADRAVVDADRTFRVRRQIIGAGLALRHRGKARTTRGTVEVWDTDHPDSPVTREQARGHQWAMRCEHGTVVGRQTLKLAREDVSDPRLWCVECPQPVRGALPLPL